jgi:hypothetical protein
MIPPPIPRRRTQRPSHTRVASIAARLIATTRKPRNAATEPTLPGSRWTQLLIRGLLRSGPRRFQDFLAAQPGLAPTVLSARLKVMEEHGLVTRRGYSTHPHCPHCARDIDVYELSIA